MKRRLMSAAAVNIRLSKVNHAVCRAVAFYPISTAWLPQGVGVAVSLAQGLVLAAYVV
jgi:hypothetical protein